MEGSYQYEGEGTMDKDLKLTMKVKRLGAELKRSRRISETVERRVASATESIMDICDGIERIRREVGVMEESHREVLEVLEAEQEMKALEDTLNDGFVFEVKEEEEVGKGEETGAGKAEEEEGAEYLIYHLKNDFISLIMRGIENIISCKFPILFNVLHIQYTV